MSTALRVGRAPALAAATTSCLLALTALADGATTLPPVLVPLPVEPGPGSLSRADPSGALTVIPVGEHRGEAKEAAELIAHAGGVQLQDSGGAGQAKWMSLRGASANGVLVFLDGVPLQGSGGMVDLSKLPVAIVDRFEVLRGGAGARLGSGGLGGALNVVTRAPSAGAAVSGQATYGSFSTLDGQLAASGSLLGGAALLLVHGASTAGDFSYLYDAQPSIEGNPLTPRVRENNAATSGGALAKYRRALGGAWSLDALGELSAGARGLPGTVRFPTVDAHEESRRALAQLTVRRAPASGGELALRAFVRAETLALRGGYYAAPLEERQLAVGGELSFSQLLADWNGLSGNAQVGREGLATGAGAVDVGWTRLSAQLMDELFLFDGVLTVAPSLRVEQVGPFTLVSPKLGVTLAVTEGLELRLNAGQAHRAPSFLERYVSQGAMLANPELRPERGLYADAAVALGAPTGPALFTATGFYALYEDLIAYEYYPPLLVKPYNFAAARAYGAELEGKLQPSPWVSASVSYTLLFSENLRDDPRYYLQELPFRPRHTLTARLTAGPVWARVRVEALLHSQASTNRSGFPVLPGHARVNLGVTSQPLTRPEVTVSLELKNALDAQGTDLTDYALPGRAAFLTLAVALDLSPERH